jgi:mannose-6-phosphate isomerase
MFVGITNEPRNYPWGSLTAISGLLGTRASGEPEAEVWLGAHAGSPARILDPAATGGATTLAEWIARDPETTVALASDAEAPRLPFLMKVLAAASPLSLQAHPTVQQAQEGFARENEAGVPVDAAFRNYKDAYPKPELMLALSDTFEALCGFRPVASTQAILDGLLTADVELAGGNLAELVDSDAPLAERSPIASLHARLQSDADLASTFEWLISRGEGVDLLVARVVAAASALAEAGPVDQEIETVVSLAEQYPGDPGIVISLLINRVSLKRGEVLYLPAGNIHAYLDGLGIEVMASSDNVLRGGLTPKHVDVPELLRVLDFTPLPVPYLPPTALADGVVEFRPDVPDFVLVHAEGQEVSATYALDGPAIALCLSGAFEISGAATSTTISRGESVYVTPSEGPLRLTGSGEMVLATSGS